MALSNNPSHDHHFVPVFYLENWADPHTGKVTEFKKRYNGVLPRLTAPKGTGYKKFLYDSDDGSAVSLEASFMMPADTHAAEASRLMLASRVKIDWTQRQRSGWSRFMMGMLLRHPEDVAELARLVDDDWTNLSQTMQDRYYQYREPEMPSTAEEWWEQNRSEFREKARLKWHRDLIDHKGIGRRLNSMSWNVANVTDSKHILLTSDRPVIINGAISDRDVSIMVPLSPTKLFIAVRDEKTLAQITGESPTQLVARVNRQVVANARSFVFGSDARYGEFIKKHFATSNESSLMQKLAEKRRLERLAKQPTPPR
ncbi:DUF4238 domain-containing protein [Rhizobium acidisoli]|uniref:DUF4238 domain-containing protein n=1 Tax=Rhizobium acidisoli TaxID=1538158 RepID=A0AAE5U075_9HYPH|nr:DUF4238 domain-containing protein [Rhizobium acidisoli]KPH09112.1 hypothetical protein AOG23_07480 [Rhizobium acidisoli]QAS80176.1 DUF4238 domain-containing protein [Rhizobium acidisoli]